MKKARTDGWRRGERARLAQWAGITPSYLCDLLHRRKRASSEVAVKLAAACIHLGLGMTIIDWVNPDESKSSWWLA